MPRSVRLCRSNALAAVAACAAVYGFAAPPAAVAAEPAAEAQAKVTERPARGMKKSEVEARYGAPATRHGAVGQPPIERWDYPGLIVFFEYDHVVHAVLASGG